MSSFCIAFAFLLLTTLLVAAIWLLVLARRQARRDDDSRPETRDTEQSQSERVFRMMGAGVKQSSQILATVSDSASGPHPDSSPHYAASATNADGTGKTVLIADDDADVAQVLSMRLSQIGIHSVRTSDALHALIGIHKILPDLIIMDVNIPSGNGLAVCEMLASDPHRANVPVLVYTGCSDEATINRCRELHLHYVHKAPGSWDHVRTLVCRLLELKSTEAVSGTAPVAATEVTVAQLREGLPPLPVRTRPLDEPALPALDPPEARESVKSSSNRSGAAKSYRVLVIDDDPDISRVLSLRLRPFGIDVLSAFTGLQGFRVGLESIPDLIITDMNMPDGEGNYIFGRFRSHPLTAEIPIIVLTGQDSAGLKRQMLSLGVTAYLRKPIVVEELMHQLRQHLDLPSAPRPRTSQRLEAAAAAM